MQPINNLEEAYTADVIRRTERTFAPRDELKTKLMQQYEADVASGIRPTDSASYAELIRHRDRPKKTVPVAVSFLIERRGEVHDIEVVEDSGYDFVNAAATLAAQNAAPFRPVPKEFECPFKVFVRMHAYIDDPTVAAADEIPKTARRMTDGRKLHEIVERYGGWERVLSADYQITDEMLTAIEAEAAMDRAVFLSMKEDELQEPRTKALRAAANALNYGWFSYQHRIANLTGGQQKGHEEWERIVANFWHQHGAKLDEFGISIDDVVTEIETDCKSYPNVNTEMFLELTQIRKPGNSSVRKNEP